MSLPPDRSTIEQLPPIPELVDATVFPGQSSGTTGKTTFQQIREAVLAPFAGGGGALVDALNGKAGLATANTFTAAQTISPLGLGAALARILTLRAPMTAPGVANSGVGILFSMQKATGGVTDSAAFDVVWTDPNAYTSRVDLTLFNAGTPVNALTIAGTGGLLIHGANAYTLRSNTYFFSSGTWTRPSGCRMVRVSVQAAGGGGGGAGTGTPGNASGGGGGGGAFAVAFIAAPASAVVTIGAAGANGAPNAAGSAGGASSFGALLACNGGAGGGASPILNVLLLGAAPGAGGAVTIVGNANIDGGVGCYGLINAPQGQSSGGSGGSSVLGHGGGQIREGNHGRSATGYGGGGGGGAGTPAFPAWGGIGTQGVVIVEEYY